MKILIISLLLSMSNIVVANVVGTEAQNFCPTTSGKGFVTVHASETLSPCFINIGAFLNYAVNTFPNLKVVQSGSGKIEPDNDLTSLDLNFGMGITKKWDFGISLPMIVDQNVDNTQLEGFYDNSGITDFRFNTKYQFSSALKGLGFAAIFSANFPRITNDPFIGNDGGPIFNFELALDKQWNDIKAAINLGYRFRNKGTKVSGVGIFPLEDQYLLSLGLTIPTSKNIDLIFELINALPSKKSENATTKENSTHEALASLKYYASQKMAIYFGGGLETISGTHTPDYHVFTGLNYTFGSVCKKQVKRRKPVLEKPRKNKKYLSKKVNLMQFNLTGLNFKTGSDEIVKDSNESLVKLIKYLKDIDSRKTREIQKVILIGHTDNRGGTQYNYELGLKRSNAVKKYLIKYTNLNESLIITKSSGELKPLVPNTSESNYYQNRRVEVKVYSRRIQKILKERNQPLNSEEASGGDSTDFNL